MHGNFSEISCYQNFWLDPKQDSYKILKPKRNTMNLRPLRKPGIGQNIEGVLLIGGIIAVPYINTQWILGICPDGLPYSTFSGEKLEEGEFLQLETLDFRREPSKGWIKKYKYI